MYLFNTRPNICYAMNQLSQVMVKPTKLFWKVGKHVLRYLRGTSKYGLWYRHTDEVKLHGFMDQIGQATQQKERAHQEGFLVLDLQKFLGTVGNKDLWHSVHQSGIHGNNFNYM